MNLRKYLNSAAVRLTASGFHGDKGTIEDEEG